MEVLKIEELSNTGCEKTFIEKLRQINRNNTVLPINFVILSKLSNSARSNI